MSTQLPSDASAVETNAATSVVTIRHTPWQGTVHVFRVRWLRRLFTDVISTLIACELLSEPFTLKCAVLKTVLMLYNLQFTCDVY